MSPRSESGTLFAYRALRADGSEQRGEVQAATRAMARDQVVAWGLFPVDLRVQATLVGRRASIPIGDLAVGLRLLSSLLAAGLPLERALGIFQHVAPASWGEQRIVVVRDAAREGTSLARALRDADLGAPAHVTGIIEAGEAAGTLVEALREVATLVEQAAERIAAIRGALAYPAILAIAGMIAVGMLVGIVLPRFAVLLADVGQQLPPTTRLLLALSHAVTRWWWLLISIPVIAGTWVAHRWQRDESARRRILDLMLATPVIGPLRQATAGARLTAALAAMLGSGVPLASALSQSARAAGDDAIAARALEARDGVIRGERLSAAFGACMVVRPSVIQLIRAGEASGELSEMLRASARIESEWSMARISMLTRLIEPSLILCFGAIIAFVAAALLQAVYSIRPTP